MADGSHPRTATTPARLVLVVSIVLLVNYIDRGNLATAVPLIHSDLGLSATQLGFLLSAFYYSYVAAMVPAGWLAQRYGGHRVLAAGIGIWSLATLLTGFATGFWSLLVLRLLLGVGESSSQAGCGRPRSTWRTACWDSATWSARRSVQCWAGS
jgi:MFS family permease